MAYRPLRLLRSSASALLLAAVAAACSPAYVSADGDEDDSGGSTTDDSDGSDGSDGSGGSTDGSDGSGGETATGGSDGESGGAPSDGGSTGGSETGTGGDDAKCDDSDECIAAANFDDECFSASCSGPVAATASEVERNPCLVPWEERESEIPEECAAHNPMAPCPLACEVPPPCVDASCVEATGECVIELCLP